MDERPVVTPPGLVSAQIAAFLEQSEEGRPPTRDHIAEVLRFPPGGIPDRWIDGDAAGGPGLADRILRVCEWIAAGQPSPAQQRSRPWVSG